MNNQYDNGQQSEPRDMPAGIRMFKDYVALIQRGSLQVVGEKGVYRSEGEDIQQQAN